LFPCRSPTSLARSLEISTLRGMFKGYAWPLHSVASRLFVVWGLVTLPAACGMGNRASGLADPPKFAPTDQTKCAMAKSQAEPLIVAWPSASRAQLESKARKGGVVVHYRGCEMRVLTQCSAPGKYGYTGTTRKRDRLVMRDVDELYANLPMGAARVEATLAKSGALSVDMVIVGRYEAERPRLRKDELEGDCGDATHVVSALTVGAFAFVSGAEGSANGSVLGASGGATGALKREVIAEDGDPEGCDGAMPSDKAPPEQCGALLRLEVTPLGEAKRLAASCPAGTVWDGAQCMGKEVVTKVDCPGGTIWDGAKCAGIASTECAAGTHFEAGRGCLPNMVPLQPDTPRSSPVAAPQGDASVGTMASIPAGSFMMGSNDGKADEKPVHRVNVAAFWMDITEVTTAAYTACVRAGRCSAAGTAEYCNFGRGDKSNHPINCVNWYEASAYCESLGKRLPTEEEWEYAARGTDGRKYSWGNEEPGTRACWKRVSDKVGTCAVGSYPSGVFGLKDMNGNLWEWTASGYSDDYGKSRTTATRVARGGSRDFADASTLRSSDRGRGEPSKRALNVGFRCARSMPPPKQ
jgi:formylglycine-generating enzyme required for sulfatase activity